MLKVGSQGAFQVSACRTMRNPDGKVESKVEMLEEMSASWF